MTGMAGLGLAPATGWAQPALPLRLGVDGLIQDSGLAGRWKTAMARDLGLSAEWVRAPSGSLLKQLESGALPVGLFLSSPLADQLERQGLIHDRHTLARTQVLLVGPQEDPAGLKGEPDAVRALAQILAGQSAGACRWQPADQDSALNNLADSLMASLGARKLPAPPSSLPSYQLMTQADWQTLPRDARKALKVMVDADPRLWLTCQVARSFRTPHPAGKLLVQWLQGPLGRKAVVAAGSTWQGA